MFLCQVLNQPQWWSSRLKVSSNDATIRNRASPGSFTLKNCFVYTLWEPIRTYSFMYWNLTVRETLYRRSPFYRRLPFHKRLFLWFNSTPYFLRQPYRRPSCRWLIKADCLPLRMGKQRNKLNIFKVNQRTPSVTHFQMLRQFVSNWHDISLIIEDHRNKNSYHILTFYFYYTTIVFIRFYHIYLCKPNINHYKSDLKI